MGFPAFTRCARYLVASQRVIASGARRVYLGAAWIAEILRSCFRWQKGRTESGRVDSEAPHVFGPSPTSDCRTPLVTSEHRNYGLVGRSLDLHGRVLYQLCVDKTQGLGISLGWTGNKSVVVAGFLELPHGKPGPVELSGAVNIQDQLIKVNGTEIKGLPLVEVSELIRSSKRNLILEFEESSESASRQHSFYVVPAQCESNAFSISGRPQAHSQAA